MSTGFKRRLGITVVTAAVIAFAGGAYAAAQDPATSSSRSFWGDVAHRLNVTPQQLRTAIQGAAIDQVNAALAAGKLSKDQANAIKQRIEQSGGFPFFGPGFFGGPRPFLGGPGPFFGPLRMVGPNGALLQAAAKYLGLTAAQLKRQLASGKTLQQIAQARGKSLLGLRQAIAKGRGMPPLFGPRRFYGQQPLFGPAGPPPALPQRPATPY
jgi:hypothetical protein